MSRSTPAAGTDANVTFPLPALVLAALFVTALVTAQLTASKLLVFAIPGGVTIPRVGDAIVLPGAALAYAVTFFASDCVAELYGKRTAQRMVNVGFVMNLVMLVLVWSTILAPAVDPGFAGQFRAVLAASTNVVLGSLLAYLVSQNWDVVVFHRIRDYTGGKYLWLRNLGSTATSQLIDTVIFIGVAFYVAPRLLGVGPAESIGFVVSLIIGQYLFKLLVAVVDTPFVYAVVYYVAGGVKTYEDRLAQ